MARSFGNLRFEGGDKKQPRCDPRMYVGSLGATYVSDQLSSGQGRDRERCVLCTMDRPEYDTGCFFNWVSPEFAKCWPVREPVIYVLAEFVR